MCDAMSAAAAVASLYGTKMQSDAQNDAIDKQQRAVNASLEQQDQYSRAAESKALENAQNYDPTKRTEEFNKARETAGESLAQQLTQAREAAPKTSQPAGRLSAEFLTGQAKSAADQYDKSVQMAQLMGKMRGANDLLTNEGYRNADYASQLGTIGRNAKGAYDAAQPGIIAAGKVDGGKMMLGSLASSLGTAYLGSKAGDLFSTGPTMSGAGSATENWIDSGGLMNSRKSIFPWG
jgi:hypothetical protein